MATELAAQRVLAQQPAEPLHDRLREVLAQVGLEERVVDQPLSSASVRLRFASASRIASSGRDTPSPARRRSAISSAGQLLDRAVEQPLLLELRHQVLVGEHARRGPRTSWAMICACR